MEKRLLQKKYFQKRAVLSESERESLSMEIANKCLEVPIWNKSNYHIFLSIPEKGEINTEYLLHILQGKDKNIIVPKTDLKTQTLSHYLLTDNTIIKKNNWGIPEPVDGILFLEEKIEVVFVPLLAFDKKGNRVGYGKGFYDKFLSQCNETTIKVGLSLFEAEENEVPAESTDIPLNYCVTPKNIFHF